MLADAKKIGNVFREKREEKKVSLKEAESVTSIRSNYLRAIEEGELEKFLSAVYLHGFMRQYAQFLGIDIDKLMQEYPDAFSALKNGKQDFICGIGTLEVKGNAIGSVQWLSQFFWGSLFVACVFVVWWVARKFGFLS